MPLLEDVKLDVIRHLGYPVMGLYPQGQAGGALAYGGAGWRFFGGYGALLFKMNMLRPIEEAKITGLATAAVFFTGILPNPGDVITVALSSPALMSPITATVTVPMPVNGLERWDLLTVASALATAFMLQPAFAAAGFFAIADYGRPPFSQITPVAICSINSSGGNFTLTPSFTGSTVPQISGAGKPVSPYIPVGGGCITGHVPILNYLEAAIGGASASLGVLVANTTTLRHDELEQREWLYEKYQIKLADFLEIPLFKPRRNNLNVVY